MQANRPGRTRRVHDFPGRALERPAYSIYCLCIWLQPPPSPRQLNRQGRYTGKPLSRHRVFEMVRRRARQAGIEKDISCHSFRATGITEFLKAGGRLDRAQRRAHHADSRTTKVYDHSD